MGRAFRRQNFAAYAKQGWCVMKQKEASIGLVCYTSVAGTTGKVQVEILREKDQPAFSFGKKHRTEYVVKRTNGKGRELVRTAAALHNRPRSSFRAPPKCKCDTNDTGACTPEAVHDDDEAAYKLFVLDVDEKVKSLVDAGVLDAKGAEKARVTMLKAYDEHVDPQDSEEVTWGARGPEEADMGEDDEDKGGES